MTADPGGVDWSISSWQQPPPPAATPARAAAIERVVELIDSLGAGRLRVAVDGRTAAGKTSLGHELALGIAGRGRRSLRASLDDFKRPWSEAHRYDRVSGEGYYRNAFDAGAARSLLLEPAGADGSGSVALCSIDPITQVDHSSHVTRMPADGVLIVDGTFACRPEIDHYWDLRIWVEVDAGLALRRGTDRDAEMEGGIDAAEQLHRDRYGVAEEIYLAEVDPLDRVQVVIDNTDFDRPVLLRLEAPPPR